MAEDSTAVIGNDAQTLSEFDVFYTRGDSTTGYKNRLEGIESMTDCFQEIQFFTKHYKWTQVYLTS